MIAHLPLAKRDKHTHLPLNSVLLSRLFINFFFSLSTSCLCFMIVNVRFFFVVANKHTKTFFALVQQPSRQNDRTGDCVCRKLTLRHRLWFVCFSPLRALRVVKCTQHGNVVFYFWWICTSTESTLRQKSNCTKTKEWKIKNAPLTKRERITGISDGTQTTFWIEEERLWSTF